MGLRPAYIPYSRGCFRKRMKQRWCIRHLGEFVPRSASGSDSDKQGDEKKGDRMYSDYKSEGKKRIENARLRAEAFLKTALTNIASEKDRYFPDGLESHEQRAHLFNLIMPDAPQLSRYYLWTFYIFFGLVLSSGPAGSLLMLFYPALEFSYVFDLLYRLFSYSGIIAAGSFHALSRAASVPDRLGSETYARLNLGLGAVCCVMSCTIMWYCRLGFPPKIMFMLTISPLVISTLCALGYLFGQGSPTPAAIISRLISFLSKVWVPVEPKLAFSMPPTDKNMVKDYYRARAATFYGILSGLSLCAFAIVDSPLYKSMSALLLGGKSQAMTELASPEAALMMTPDVCAFLSRLGACGFLELAIASYVLKDAASRDRLSGGTFRVLGQAITLYIVLYGSTILHALTVTRVLSWNPYVAILVVLLALLAVESFRVLKSENVSNQL